jgi:hypothetical protein
MNYVNIMDKIIVDTHFEICFFIEMLDIHNVLTVGSRLGIRSGISHELTTSLTRDS